MKGGARATHHGRPWSLILTVAGFVNRGAALSFEYRVKRRRMKNGQLRPAIGKAARVQNLFTVLNTEKWNAVSLNITWYEPSARSLAQGLTLPSTVTEKFASAADACYPAPASAGPPMPIVIEDDDPGPPATPPARPRKRAARSGADTSAEDRSTRPKPLQTPANKRKKPATSKTSKDRLTPPKPPKPSAKRGIEAAARSMAVLAARALERAKDRLSPPKPPKSIAKRGKAAAARTMAVLAARALERVKSKVQMKDSDLTEARLQQIAEDLQRAVMPKASLSVSTSSSSAESGTPTTTMVLSHLEALESWRCSSFRTLHKTGLGLAVAKLRQFPDPSIAEKAKNLRNRWKEDYCQKVAGDLASSARKA